MAPHKKIPAFYLRRVREQREWIELCGRNLSGYVANYTAHGRTPQEAEAIYLADLKALADYEAAYRETQRYIITAR